MSGDEPSVLGITQRELLMEMRDDIRALRGVVDAVAREQALSVERRASMQRVADTITARLDSHEKAILGPSVREGSRSRSARGDDSPTRL